MNLNRYKSKSRQPSGKEQKTEKRSAIPKLEDFITRRDYTGAIVLLEHQRHSKEANALTLPWLGFAAFHLGDYKKAFDVYQEILSKPDADPVYYLLSACCLFYLGEYKDAEDQAVQGPENRLQNRILFHIAHKLNDEKKLLQYHQQLTDSVEDQLCLAAIHYLRSHFQEATEVYKKLLLENREHIALQVYVAMCYYKLDYYDVSLDILQPYLLQHKDSAIGINLKACNHFKLYDGKAAEVELKGMVDLLQSSSAHMDNNLIRHNLVVFRNGENALQVLPPLLDVIPEARLNLVIYHLRKGEITEATELIKDLDPSTPQEYILKAVSFASYGLANENKEKLKLAQQLYQLVGASASECDTIPGRQCMASCFFLLKQFEDVLVYLRSVKQYQSGDQAFWFNYGQALAEAGEFKEAEEALLQVTDERLRVEYVYLSWLARCYIMNGQGRHAWELYLKIESNTDSFAMLVLIANDCYKAGSFYYSAKAFDVLERLDPSPEYFEGKRGACCGVFQQVIARREKKERLLEVISLLRNGTNTPQVEFIVRVMAKWANENGLPIAL